MFFLKVFVQTKKVVVFCYWQRYIILWNTPCFKKNKLCVAQFYLLSLLENGCQLLAKKSPKPLILISCLIVKLRRLAVFLRLYLKLSRPYLILLASLRSSCLSAFGIPLVELFIFLLFPVLAI